MVVVQLPEAAAELEDLEQVQQLHLLQLTQFLLEVELQLQEHILPLEVVLMDLPQAYFQ
jgi:hypothetical protein